MDFHGALGRGAWQLQANPEGAELSFADGRQAWADSVDELVRSEAGWPIPVASLAWWVRGLAAPGEVERLELDEQGQPSDLRQYGWSVEYGPYGAVGGESLPMRMIARQGDRVVKLAVRKWQLAVPGDAL
jgi:outer membrane lipoprotein LolB